METRGRAYRLHLAPYEIDVGRFERLLTEGRQTSDVGAAAERYAAALELWRGPAYADVLDGTDAELAAEAHRLDELRLTVLERRAATDLELGRHEKVAAELTGAVAEHPLRETLRARLILALSRSGRRVEALKAYDDGRRRLADELGIGPSPELRDLEYQLLATDDPASVPAAAVPTAAGKPAPAGTTEPGGTQGPAELPAAPPAFVGRADEIRELMASPMTALSGVGGVGKTALAIKLAHGVADRYPDGQLYVDLGGSAPDRTPIAPGDLVRRLLRSLGETGPDTSRLTVDELAGRLRSVLAGRRVLIVLDDVADAAQTRPILPSAPECGVLLTCRQVLGSIPNARHHRLGPLSEADGLRLLTELVGADRITAEPHSAEAIVRLTDGLPLAMVTAAARLAARPRWSVAELARRLADPERRLDELSDDQGGIRERFAGSYRRLPAEASRVFRLVGRDIGGVVHVTTAAEIAGLDRPDAESALDQIADVQLAESCSGQRYQFSRLIRLFARELAAG